MTETKHTPGPWRWQGEDYRAGWGWQMLVGPKGEGIIVGQDIGGGPCKKIRAFVPIDPALCITGMAADGKPHVEAVHVFGEANAALIAAAPDMLTALKQCIAALETSMKLGWNDKVNPLERWNALEPARAAIAKAESKQL